MKALISVYDKTGVAEFAGALHRANIALVSTGGTYDLLANQVGLPVQKVSDLISFPEILAGRVKTLHPRIHGGLLARRDNPDDMSDLKQQGISTIDLVAVNLYPFVETSRKENVAFEQVIENIDIGGPTLLRAGAKNFSFVIVVVDPLDYVWVANKIGNGGLNQEERRRLAYKAFRHISKYDAEVANYLSQQCSNGLPSDLSLTYHKVYDLRYGENPHQEGALYSLDAETGGIPGATLRHGRELSFNNLLDADAAWRVVNDFEQQTVVVIKHTNPCGLASNSHMAEAYRLAYQGDTVSAYGGIVGFNRVVDLETTEAMKGVFYEVVVAPGYEPEAFDMLKKRRNLRILQMTSSGDHVDDFDLRPVNGGLLAQTHDAIQDDPGLWNTVTDREPSLVEMSDLIFAWKAVRHIKSNAIVMVKESSLLGMGAGQPNRVTSVDLALRGSLGKAKDIVLASDAFFPFPDNVELAAQGGITAIVQPGGSIRDQEAIDAANRHNIAMVFTGRRHFRH